MNAEVQNNRAQANAYATSLSNDVIADRLNSSFAPAASMTMPTSKDMAYGPPTASELADIAGMTPGRTSTAFDDTFSGIMASDVAPMPSAQAQAPSTPDFGGWGVGEAISRGMGISPAQAAPTLAQANPTEVENQDQVPANPNLGSSVDLNAAARDALGPVNATKVDTVTGAPLQGKEGPQMASAPVGGGIMGTQAASFNTAGALPSFARDVPNQPPLGTTQAVTVTEDEAPPVSAPPSTNVTTTPDLSPANPTNAAAQTATRAASPRSTSITGAAPRSSAQAATRSAARAAAPVAALSPPVSAPSFPSLAAGLNRGLSLAEIYEGTNFGQSFDQAQFGAPGSMSSFGTPFDDIGVAMPHDAHMGSLQEAQAFFDKQGQMGLLDALSRLFGGGMSGGGMGGSRDTGYSGGTLGDGSFSSHSGYNDNSPQGML